jgi:hypothetical protein
VSEVTRREALAAMTGVVAAGLVGRFASGAADLRAVATPVDDRRKLKSVAATLLPGRALDQVRQTRGTYLNMPEDDFLYGFRKRAKQATPGRAMTGWCGHESSVIFGQVVSGLARMSSYLHDPALAEKAVRLYEGWRKTAGDNGEFFSGTYGFDKFACGIVDLKQFAGYDATEYLGRMTEFASKHFDRTRSPAGPMDWDGRQPKGTLEWYTLGENLYRAFSITGNEAFKTFADVWQYPAFWNKFAGTDRPTDAFPVHAYSHVNTFSSAATAYGVTGDTHFLDVIKNAWSYLQATQCYATGGYGPIERLIAPDGGLGRSLSYVTDHAEIGCGSWAAFKLSKYLIEFTGDGRYGDWIEQVFYNSIGASLPVTGDGKTYYYADYRPSGGDKLYYWENWPCCAGTYIQAVGDYHANIFFQGDAGIFVNLFTPAEATVQVGATPVTVRMETSFPESAEVRVTISCGTPTRFALAFRKPAWCDGMSATVKDASVAAVAADGWFTINRTWSTGDVVKLNVPMKPRLSAVDVQHPDRCAVMYGPVVLGQDARYTRPLMLKDHGDLARRFKPADRPLHFRVDDDVVQNPNTGPFRPMWAFGIRETYRMYHDLKEPYLY